MSHPYTLALVLMGIGTFALTILASHTMDAAL